MLDDYVIAELYFSNTFNCLHRDTTMESIQLHVPETLNFYFVISHMVKFDTKFGSQVISSEEDTQQGDPLGPLIFCLSFHPLLQSLSSDFIVSYYRDDIIDIIVLGPEASVTSNVNLIKTSGAAYGLCLNIAKCEYIPTAHAVTTAPLCQFVQLDVNSSSLLGAPLSIGDSMDSALT